MTEKGASGSRVGVPRMTRFRHEGRSTENCHTSNGMV